MAEPAQADHTPGEDFALAPTRAAAVTQELRRLILSGEVPAGAPLRQGEIAARFRVSTTPVREAFAALAREGLVRQDAHRGVVVFLPSLDDLAHNYEIRLALEPLAAGHAATELTSAGRERLTKLVAQMRRAMEAGDIAHYGDVLNARFHATVNEAARRPRLADMIEALRDAAKVYTQVLILHPQPPSYVDMAHREHEEIVDALCARAPRRAATAMARHLEHNRDQLFRQVTR
ncbi:MAG: transcriptional regulator, GntR family [Conexibacter sp.]|nr:transcriptional regulator, GntR family [Conexibacter sp.]